VKVTINISHKH